MEDQRQAVVDVFEAARLLFAVRGLESELQRVLEGAIQEADVQGVPQVVITEAAAVSAGWVSRLLKRDGDAGQWRELLQELRDDPARGVTRWGHLFTGVVAEPPYPHRRAVTARPVRAIPASLTEDADPVSESVTSRLEAGMIPVLTLPHELAHQVAFGEVVDVLEPWGTWYRGEIGIHARGAGSGERGAIIAVATLREVHAIPGARPGESFRWALQDPRPLAAGLTGRRGAGDLYWAFVPR